MDGSQRCAADKQEGRPLALRSFLFLQGPISNFFDRLGRALIARGHQVHRVNLHLGDRLFWHLPATNFRGRFDAWHQFVGELMDRHQITDLIVHGDRRPYHIVAAEEARARGIAVIATDLGYVRPDWLTLEFDGMTTYSRFPRDPAAIRALAAELPEPAGGPAFHTPFWLIASCDIVYNLGLVCGRLFYPHYRYHSTCHPFLEYVGWLKSRPRKLLGARATRAAKERLRAAPGSYFLAPLQLTTDFQIRAHSPFDDLRAAVREIVRSFAASGSRRKLVFVVHPLDNGLIDWHRLIARLAAERGVADRVVALHGGTPTALLRSAAGCVTINSTVGVTALAHGVPVKALGNAVFNVAGLTCQAALDDFWQAPAPPDPALLALFLRALIGTTQVRGGYYERGSQDRAIAGFVDRLEQRPYPLPPLAAAEMAARAPRAISRTVVVTGVSGPLGLALARHQAGPGIRLCLLGGAPEILAQAAADCRQRGAVVDTYRADTPLADCLAALDRRAPVDLLVINGESEPDIFGAMDAVTALAESMRRRGRGIIVLVGDLSGHAAIGGKQAARRAIQSWRSQAAALRRRLRDDGVTVAVATPGGLAAWLGEWPVEIAGPDRIAEGIGRTVERRRERIAIPGAAATLARALRLWPSRARLAFRATLLPRAGEIAGEIAEAAEEAPLTGKSASGD